MPDLGRAYHRWTVRKLSAILPAMAGAMAVAFRQIFVLTSESSTLWIDLASLGAAVALAGLCAFLAGRALWCYWRFLQGRGDAARELRHELESAGSMAIVGFSLAVLAAVLPSCFSPLEPIPGAPLRTAPAEKSARTEVPRLHPKATPPPSTVSRPEPRRIVPLAIEPGEGRFSRFQEEAPSAWEVERVPRLGRLGVPDRDHPFEWMRPQLRAEILILEPSGSLAVNGDDTLDLENDLQFNAAGFLLDYRVPTGLGEAVEFQYRLLGMTSGDGAEDPDLSSLLLWQRFAATYAWQVEGYHSDATFDLTLLCGVMGDLLLASAYDGLASEQLRLSPYLGIEFGFWQTGPAGLILHLGQSIPLNVTGATAKVTDASAHLRFDLSHGLSIQLGYAGFWGEFRGYDQEFSDDGERSEMSVRLQGPSFGVDVRF